MKIQSMNANAAITLAHIAESVKQGGYGYSRSIPAIVAKAGIMTRIARRLGKLSFRKV